MAEQKYDFGMIGLGTMGSNFVFNISDHGFSVAGFDKSEAQVELTKKEAGDRKIFVTTALSEFMQVLKSPRVIILLVPAGKIVDDVINELKAFLSEGDLLMDCGNSHYTDTNTRISQLQESGINFMGVGVSGGDEGARLGASIMPGGSKGSYEYIAPMLEAIAAKVDNKPCVSWIGPGSAGHYVKMVHNGIEYGLMQLISEAYHLLKVGCGMSNKELCNVFSKWNQGILHSFLIEITADIFAQKDELTNNGLIDTILDSAQQKGTGGWTSQEGIKLRAAIPVIDVAVSMRDLSGNKKERQRAQQILKGPEAKFNGNKEEFTEELEQALYFAMIITYAQGMGLLHFASIEYQYNLQLEEIAKIWRGGCIIRSRVLEDLHSAYAKEPNLSNAMLDEDISQKVMRCQKDIRRIIQTGVATGIPLPAMMSCLSYYDSYRSGWLPANLVQAQRDYFGAHTYERNDRAGIFHTIWNQKND